LTFHVTHGLSLEKILVQTHIYATASRFESKALWTTRFEGAYSCVLQSKGSLFLSISSLRLDVEASLCKWDRTIFYGE